MIVLLFHRQRDNLTELLQIKFNHSSLILIGGIECYNHPRSPLLENNNIEERKKNIYHFATEVAKKKHKSMF